MYKSVESMIGDFMKKWKTISAIAMTAAALLCSGCGNPTMLEEYSFGYVQLKKGDSEVYLQTPFDLGRIDTKDEAGQAYMNRDKHITIIAESEPKENGTLQDVANVSMAKLKQTANISDLQMKVTDTTASGRPAVAIDSSYAVQQNGQKTPIVVQSLFFEDNGQIWHVMYMYRQGDDMGKEVTDHIFGQLK